MPLWRCGCAWGAYQQCGAQVAGWPMQWLPAGPAHNTPPAGSPCHCPLLPQTYLLDPRFNQLAAWDARVPFGVRQVGGVRCLGWHAGASRACCAAAVHAPLARRSFVGHPNLCDALHAIPGTHWTSPLQVEGTEDPLDARVVLHGWFSKPVAYVTGKGDVAARAAALEPVQPIPHRRAERRVASTAGTPA